MLDVSFCLSVSLFVCSFDFLLTGLLFFSLFLILSVFESKLHAGFFFLQAVSFIRKYTERSHSLQVRIWKAEIWWPRCLTPCWCAPDTMVQSTFRNCRVLMSSKVRFCTRTITADRATSQASEFLLSASATPAVISLQNCPSQRRYSHVTCNHHLYLMLVCLSESKRA